MKNLKGVHLCCLIIVFVGQFLVTIATDDNTTSNPNVVSVTWERTASTVSFPYLQVKLHTLECRGYKDIEFIQIECHTRISCRRLTSGIAFKSGRDSLLFFVKTMQASDCYPPSNHNSGCKSLPILNKGFFLCKTKPNFHGTFNYMGTVSTNMNYYFVGFDGQVYVGNVDPPDSAILKMEVVNQTDSYVAVPGTITVSCEANSFHFENNIEWFFVFHNETEVLVPSENITDVETENQEGGNPLRISNLELGDRSVEQIKCAASLLIPSTDGNDTERSWKFSSMNLTLEDAYAPIIEISDALKVKYFQVGGVNQFLTCNVDANPLSEIKWTVNGKEPGSPFVIVDNFNSKLLQFPFYNESFEGEYVCTATNRIGTTSQTFKIHTLTQVTSSAFSLWKIFAIVFAICLFLIFPVMCVIVRRLRQRIKDLLTDEDIREFMEGPSSCEEKNLALAMPYNENYELLPSQFEIDMEKLLGKGEFGVVYLGTVSNENYTGNAAFKTLRSNSGAQKLKSLLSELKIMIYIGNHENVITLIGAYTKDIRNGLVYIATELCSLGSLESYLRHINEKIDNVETETGKIVSVQTDNLPEIVSREQLCNWSSQIANGMEYLAFKHVVHSDLATRNILLNSDGIAKITDFGLSRQMYNCYNYVKKGRNDPLPWKWMALESLRTLTFSTQSDVWAYGITLWEIFSLGAVPYPGISWTPEFPIILENGLRNPKPKRADLQIFSVMQSCWNKNPRDRPSFYDLKVFFMKTKIEPDTKEQNDMDKYTIMES